MTEGQRATRGHIAIQTGLENLVGSYVRSPKTSRLARMLLVAGEVGVGLREMLVERNIQTVEMGLVGALADIGWTFDADYGQNKTYYHPARFREP